MKTVKETKSRLHELQQLIEFPLLAYEVFVLKHDPDVYDEDYMINLLETEEKEHLEHLEQVDILMKMMRQKGEKIGEDNTYLCLASDIPKNAIIKAYSCVCKLHPGIVTYFRLIYKYDSNFYICSSYNFIP